MEEIIKFYLIKILGLVDAFPTRMTNRTEFQDLVNKLHPISTDKELIRLGPKNDGGYLVPNDLLEIEACFSPGVSVISGFEKDCADLGIPVFMADKSVDKPVIDHKLFHFTKKFVGVTSDEEFMTLDDWVTLSIPNYNSDLLLQIDVDGYEYEIFLSASQSLMKRFRIIVAEFHQLHHLWSKPFFSLASRVFEKILETHLCVHIHPNNCWQSIEKDGLSTPPVMEFTFLRKDRALETSYETKFPHPLDYDNTDKPSLILPNCWYRGK